MPIIGPGTGPTNASHSQLQIQSSRATVTPMSFRSLARGEMHLACPRDRTPMELTSTTVLGQLHTCPRCSSFVFLSDIGRRDVPKASLTRELTTIHH